MMMGPPNGFGDHPVWLGTSQLGKGTLNGDDDHRDGGDHPMGTHHDDGNPPVGTPNGSEDHHDGGDHPVGTHHDDGNPPVGTPNGSEEPPMGLGTPQLGKGTPNRSEDHHDGGNHPMGTHHDDGDTQRGHPMGVGTTMLVGTPNGDPP